MVICQERLYKTTTDILGGYKKAITWWPVDKARKPSEKGLREETSGREYTFKQKIVQKIVQKKKWRKIPVYCT